MRGSSEDRLRNQPPPGEAQGIQGASADKLDAQKGSPTGSPDLSQRMRGSSEDRLRNQPPPGEAQGIQGASADKLDAGKRSLFGRPGGTNSNRAAGRQELSGQENGAGAHGSSDDSTEPSGFRKRIRAWNNRRKITIIGSLLGIAGLGGVAGFFALSSGPFQLLHAGNLLQGFHMGPAEDFGNDRTSRMVLYALAGKGVQRGRLGVISNYTADKWEKRLTNEVGLKSIYSQRTGRLIAYEVIDPYKADAFIRDMPQTRTLRETGMVDSSGTPYNEGGNLMIDLRDDSFANRRKVTRMTTSALGVNKISAHLGSRLLIKRAGVDFHPVKNIVRKQTDKLAERREQKKEREQKLENGANAGTSGTPDGESDPDAEKRGSLGTRLRTFINTAKGPLILLAAICGLKEFSANIDAETLANQQKRMRMGMEKITLAHQVMAGWDEKDKPLDAELLGIYVDDFYDEEEKTSWSQDNSIEYESGETPTGEDYMADSKPNGDKPWFFDVVDAIPTDLADLVPGGAILGSVSGGQFSADICDALNTVGEAIANTPGIKQVFEAITWLVDQALVAFTGKTSEELIQVALEFFATGATDIAAQGARRGGYDNSGVFMAAQNQMNAMGGTVLTQEESQEVRQAAREEQKLQLANESIYNKYFNPYDSRSVVASLYFKAPKTREQTIASIQRLPSTIGSMFATFTGVKKVGAQDGTYDYGYPTMGFSLSEQGRPEVENPIANEQWLLEGDRLTRLDAEYGKECFFMNVSTNGDLTYGEAGDLTKIPDKCKDKNNVELMRYRFYLADIVTGHTLACYEGDQTSCAQIGMGGGTGAPAAGSGAAGPLDMAQIFQASDTMTCAAGTDGGVQDGYREGVLVKIRVCHVPTGAGTVVVNARIAANVAALYQDAKAQGVTMGGGGFRTMAAQIDARRRNGCPSDPNAPSSSCATPTAPPGYSNHQMGLAIDFTLGGGILRKGDAGNNWLAANSSKYGLQNYPVEPWHWSVDGK